MKKISSDYNGVLEISTYRGRKILDGQNVNLSYGSVHRIWKDGLKNVSLKDTDDTLLLGLGGGSIITLLRKDFSYKGKITAIEIDPVIVKIAAREFGIVNSSKLKIYCDDAFSWIKESKEKFDLILVDVFIEARIAPQMLKKSFWNQLYRLLNLNGTTLINFSVGGRLPAGSTLLLEQLSSKFNIEIIRNVGGSNSMLFCTRK